MEYTCDVTLKVPNVIARPGKVGMVASSNFKLMGQTKLLALLHGGML